MVKNTEQHFDAIVIGAGPGGYVAAIRLAQLGKKVACIDAWANDKKQPVLGGTCTNVGCIPSKALLHATELYEQASHGLKKYGVTTQGVSVNLAEMMAHKNKVVQKNNDGISYLFKKNKVTFFHGVASFVKTVESGYAVKVAYIDKIMGEATLTAEHVIVATGSVARALPHVVFDEKRILSNDGALRLEQVPEHLAIIGSGVIGLELGTVWRRLGAKVTILEALPEFSLTPDQAFSKKALKIFTQQGLNIELGVKVEKVESNDAGVTISYADQQGAQKEVKADHVVVSIGRVPYVQNLGLDAIGIVLDERGYIPVDESCQTIKPHIWAIGDVVRGPMLAHKAEAEGITVAESIAGQYGRVNLDTAPFVVYTKPEIAWVGKTEQQLQKEGRAYKVGEFSFLANGRARAMGEEEGMVKIIADAKTDEVLGVYMLGALVSELIAQAVMALEFKASSEDMARIFYAHPTLSEAIKEAALAVDQRAISY